MTVNKYPEDIYPKLGFRTDGFGRLTYRTTFNSDFERAYDLGYQDGQQAQGDHPLAGWSNLTEAIKAGERIDWDALDGLEAKCVHPELGVLTRKMERFRRWPANTFYGWHSRGSVVWAWAFELAWKNSGWTLWVKGELPLRKQTADQLAPGTCFKGKHPDVHDGVALNCVVVEQPNGMPKMAIYTNPITNQRASEVEVVEVYGVGTFQTPKENQ